MKTTINLAGRILYLSDNPQIMQRQLQGEDCSLAQAEPLRDNISTDEITPVTVMLDYDERLGRFPMLASSQRTRCRLASIRSARVVSA